MSEARWPHLILQLSASEESALERALTFATAHLQGEPEVAFHCEEILRALREGF